MKGYGSHANSNGLPSFSFFKLLFVGIPYFQTHGSHYISMIGTVFVQCFKPGLFFFHKNAGKTRKKAPTVEL